jgi:hypothetical protein
MCIVELLLNLSAFEMRNAFRDYHLHHPSDIKPGDPSVYPSHALHSGDSSSTKVSDTWS